MRAKQIWSYLPSLAMFKLFWSRLTFSRVTTIYFLFALTHCAIQTGLQVRAFLVNKDAALLLHDIMTTAGLTDPEFAMYDNGVLTFCMGVPGDGVCETIWASSGIEWDNGTETSSQAVPPSSTAPAMSSSSTLPLPLQSTPVMPTTSSSAQSPPSSMSTAISSSTSPPSQTKPVMPLTTSLVQSASSVTADSKSSVTSAGISPTKSASEFSISIGSASVKSSETPSTTLAGPTSLLSAPVPTANLSSAHGSMSTDPEMQVDAASETAGAFDLNIVPSSSFLRRSADLVSQMVANGTLVEISGVPLTNSTGSTEMATIPMTCATVLTWPSQMLHNTKRNDITLIAFQIWLLGVSVVALLNESIPHVGASLVTHMFATGWMAAQLVDTAAFKSSFESLTTEGACMGVNLLPEYWSQRAAVEIPMLALNCVALLVSAFFTWRLVRLFGWQTFKRLGASLEIHRFYKLVLVLSVSIQLSLFFMLALVGLWIDQLYNGAAGQFAQDRAVFEVSYVAVIVLLIPWLIAGWYGIRYEKRGLSIFFLGFAAFLIAAWCLMFISPTYRWTFITWPFFQALSSIAPVLTAITLGLGIACRLNFGKGLLDYLRTTDTDEIDSFTRELPADLEKIQFPSSSSLPTFPSRAASPATLYRMGTNDTLDGTMRVTAESDPHFAALTRSASLASYRSQASNASGHSTGAGGHLDRVDSRSSQSSSSTTSSGSRSHPRWLLE